MLTREEAAAILASPLGEAMERARAVREETRGRKVSVQVLVSAKTGICSEDCAFCSQSASAETPVDAHPLDTDLIIRRADEAAGLGAVRYCIVTSGRRVRETELSSLLDSITRIRADHPALSICVSLGLLDDRTARRLEAAGVDRYNHNLETSRRFFPSICTTHSYDDRIETLRAAKRAGLEICSGGIFGIGEDPNDIIDLFLELARFEPDSVPINLLDPRPGTTLGGRPLLDPDYALKIIALARLALPSAEIRIAGGRERVLGERQAEALAAADSIFTAGYLTTPGQGLKEDLMMIEEAGYEPHLVNVS